MSRSELGWFGAGALVGAAVALAFKKDHVASDDKVLVVRDGSVEIYVNDSKMHKKSGTKQKWSGDKAETVTVRSGPDSGNDCRTELLPPTVFEFVKFETTGGDTFIAFADNNRKLEFDVGTDKEFKFHLYRYLLEKDDVAINAGLSEVSVKPVGQQAITFTPAAGQRLCVKFK